MLTKIKIKNIYSIGECEIDFSKNRYTYLEENVVGGFVNPIALYGHNGSGKTSVFRAISNFINLMVRPVDDLVAFVVNDFKLSSIKNKRYIDLMNDNKNIDSITGTIEVYFELNERKYKYYLSTSILGRIEKEFLEVDNKEIFYRDNNIEKYKNNLYELEKNRSKLIPTLRYFASKEIDDLDIQNSYKFLSSITFVDLPRQSFGNGFVTSKLFNNVKILDLMVSKSEDVKNILRDYAEFPLYTVVKKESTDNFNNSTQYKIKYDGIDEELDYVFMSEGMKNQSVLLSIVLSLPENGILFVDEVDNALHPSAAVSFLKVIKKKKIQLVFSSHNTHLLQHLRPDQIYFAKWKKCYSSYYRLSSIYPNIREINNIEKMYLANVFAVED